MPQKFQPDRIATKGQDLVLCKASKRMERAMKQQAAPSKDLLDKEIRRSPWLHEFYHLENVWRIPEMLQLFHSWSFWDIFWTWNALVWAFRYSSWPSCSDRLSGSTMSWKVNLWSDLTIWPCENGGFWNHKHSAAKGPGWRVGKHALR